MKMTGSAYFLVVIIVIMAVVFGVSVNMEFRDLKLLPLVLSIFVFVLASVALIRELRSEDGSTEEEVRKAGVGVLQIIRPHLIGYSWLAGFFVAIYLFGFLVATPMLVLSYMRTHNGGWLTAIGLGLLLPVFAYLVFDFLLGIDLYQGVVFAWLHRMTWANG